MFFNRIVLRTVKLLVVVCLFVVGDVASLSAREWTDNTGKYHVEAEFVKIAGEKVHLRKQDGKVIAVEIARLNEEGRLAVAVAVRAAAKQARSAPGIQPSRTVDASISAGINSNTTSANSKALAKIFVIQKDLLLTRLDERLAQASYIWEMTGETLSGQSSALTKWQNSRQPLAISIGPAEAIQTAAHGLAAHRPRVLWDALPIAYQQDLNEIIHSYAVHLDPEVWQACRSVLEKAILLSRAKQEFLLNYPLVSEVLQESQSEVQSIPAWEATIDVLELLLDSDLADLAKLQTLDIGQFLDQTGVEIMQRLAGASRKTADDSFNQALLLISGMDVSLVSMVGTEATIRLASGKESELNTMILVEGKWVPAELARAWPGMMSAARAGLERLKDESFAELKPELIHQLQETEKAIDLLLATQTQEEFDKLLTGLLVAVGEK